MDTSFRKVLTSLLVLTLIVSPAAAIFSINLAEEPRDYSTVSPGAESVQIIQVLDSDGDPVNKSRIEDNSINVRYMENGSWEDMEYLKEGYYYAHYADGSDKSAVYELQDAAPTTPGRVNASEHLKSGKIDINLVTNFSSDLEAGTEVLMEAEVQDLAQYYAVDTDSSGDVSSADTFIRDRGGDGTYSSRSDSLIAGTLPEEDVSTSTSNPWSSIEHPLAFSDGNSGDNWDESSDMIVIDRNSGGTVSVNPDEVLNTGDNSEVDATEGQSLESVSSVRSSVNLVSPDSSMDENEVTVYDNDSDGVYTGSADTHIVGVTPSEGTSITHQNMIPSTMGISSYDDSSGGPWNSDTDSLVIDNDNDGSYTGSSDLVLAGSSPSPGAALNTGDVGAWNDGNAQVATQGDVEVYIDGALDEPFDPNTDGIWLESGGTNGFQADEDNVLAGTPETGDSPSQTSGLFDQWEKISAYRADSDGTFDLSEDAIIRESNGGGTFSTQADEVVAGTESLSSGTQFTTTNGIPGDWSLDVIDISTGDSWDSSRDSIVIDSNDGGTYSTTADQVINSGSNNPESGTNLVQLNSISGGNIHWVDVNNDGMYTKGDEIFRDLDGDGIYTSQPDTNIAGLSVSTAGAGRELTTSNPWSGVSEQLMFYNGTGAGWDSSGDFIARDLDQDGTFTYNSDIIVQSGESTPENGAGLTEASGMNLTFPDVTVSFTDGNTTTGIRELGVNPDGSYSNNVEIPNKPNSTIIAQVHANAPKAEIEGSVSRIIETREQGIGFSADGNIDMNIQRAGIYERNITLENFLESENRIHVEAGESISGRINMPSEVLLDPNSKENFTVSINATPAESFSGEITFTENSSGMKDSVDISVDGPDCVYRTNRMCTPDSEINITAQERGSYEESVMVRNIWLRGQSIGVQADLTGNISSYITLSAEQFQLNNARQFNMTFTADKPGIYTGELTLTSAGESLTYSLGLDASKIIELERGMSVSPQSADLGTLPEGEDVSKTFTIENTGTLPIENLSVSSNLDINPDLANSLGRGQSTDLSITFKGLSSQTGEFTVSGDTENGEVSKTVSVSASLVKPVSDMKSEIRTKVSNLRSRATSSSTLQEITSIESRISTIETEWNKGNYAEAKNIYQNSLSDLNSIQIQANPGNGTAGNSGQPVGGQPGEGTTTPTPPSGQDSGGGGAIIIFIVLLLLVLVAGFVVYTSYYPEEGDPLYEVLGER